MGFYVSAFMAPLGFPTRQIITVREGSGLYELSLKLKEEKVIRSPFWFRTAAIVLRGERGMQAGAYYLGRRQSSFVLAWRIARGKHGLETVRVTVPEGFSAKKISDLFDTRFPLFDKETFLRLAKEGYLFPDTYFIQVNATATSTQQMMRDNFVRKIYPILPDIERSKYSLEDIITMASIIEMEANTKESREIVSGILWKRLEQGIPLQVDASFVYVNGKTTADLTLDDLKIKSPYNTYLYPGLPPTPISNPGLESIVAAIHPTSTPYLYFLTGNDGQMYYAKNFEEHKQNKAKYLNN